MTAAPFYAGGREVEHGPVTEHGTIRSLVAMEKNEQATASAAPGREFGVARRVPAYGVPYPIDHED